MKFKYGLLLLVSVFCLHAFNKPGELLFFLGNNTCLLKQNIVKPGAITLIALHDNENTAIEAYNSWTAELNINLLEIHQSGDRYLKYKLNKKEYRL